MSAAIAAAAAAAATATCSSNSNNSTYSSGDPSRTQNQHYYCYQYSLLNITQPPPLLSRPRVLLGRYESQKRRDWNTFLQYLSHHVPPLSLSGYSGTHVLEFVKYLDQFGKTKAHAQNCPFSGEPNAPVPCSCPLQQAWGSLDAMIGRLRAAFEENGGQPETNPFAAPAVKLYLRKVRDEQAKARGFGF